MTVSPAVFRAATPRTARPARPVRAWALLVVSGVAISAGALAISFAGCLTAFRWRTLYSAMAGGLCRFVLRLYGISLRIHRSAEASARQHVYISNHSSSLDLFVLVALGLPRCRFFLSGFLRKLIPLGVIATLMGTFFTVTQEHQSQRRRIFARASRTLRRTGESVYLSPEGQRITGGSIGHFNRGAFHLAVTLGAPIVPIYIRIPPAVDPGMGFDARPGIVDVFLLPPIDTHEWTLDALPQHIADTRTLFVNLQNTLGA